MRLHRPPVAFDDTETRAVPEEHRRRMRHRWMMFACCVPMLAIVAALVATGVVGLSYAVWAVLCVAMMPLLHGAMSHGHGESGTGAGGELDAPDHPMR